MARCPFATWRPLSGSCGAHLGGPYKIVHHTTEGGSAEGAMQTFRAKRADPHFTVDATTIYQHVDTAEGARALVNNAGGVQTNRDSAVQIELVGYDTCPKIPRRWRTSPGCVDGSSKRMAFLRCGPTAHRVRQRMAKIPAATIATPPRGIRKAVTTATATSRRTRTGIRGTPPMKWRF
jgi:hypothetical protein